MFSGKRVLELSSVRRSSDLRALPARLWLRRMRNRKATRQPEPSSPTQWPPREGRPSQKIEFVEVGPAPNGY